MRCVRIMFVAFSVFACGCASLRHSVWSTADDVGATIATKNRYKVSSVFNGDSSEQLWFAGDFLQRYQPSVFAADGLPVVLRIKYKAFDKSYGWTFFISLLSLTVIPQIDEKNVTFSTSIEFADDARCGAYFEVVSRTESALSIYAPTPFLFFNGDAMLEGKRVFSENAQGFIVENSNWSTFSGEDALKYDVQFRRAIAYAIAVKLKELEDSGQIDAMLTKKSEHMPTVPAHDVVMLDRDAEKDFAYSFMIEIKSSPCDVGAAVAAVLHEFAKSLKEEYLDAVRGSEAAALTVAFSGLKRDGLRISGQAFVLTLKPLSLEYDASTRRGKLSVRFNNGQEAAAREWIRKNISALARDKNIALVSGEIPPVANFFVLCEIVKDGNVLEVEFKTE